MQARQRMRGVDATVAVLHDALLDASRCHASAVPVDSVQSAAGGCSAAWQRQEHAAEVAANSATAILAATLAQVRLLSLIHI